MLLSYLWGFGVLCWFAVALITCSFFSFLFFRYAVWEIPADSSFCHLSMLYSSTSLGWGSKPWMIISIYYNFLFLFYLMARTLNVLMITVGFLMKLQIGVAIKWIVLHGKHADLFIYLNVYVISCVSNSISFPPTMPYFCHKYMALMAF